MVIGDTAIIEYLYCICKILPKQESKTDDILLNSTLYICNILTIDK